MPCKNGTRDHFLKPEYKNYSDDTKKLLSLSSEELKNNIALLEKCIISLEEAIKVLTAPRKRGWNIFRMDTGANWLEGAEIGNCGSLLTEYLEGKDLLDFQERSANVWGSAILSVCAHYHHMVGPAMVANAKISEKRGNINRVKEICIAVIKDFETILESCERLKKRPSKNDELHVSLESLDYALNKIIELGNKDKKFIDMKERVDSIWQRI